MLTRTDIEGGLRAVGLKRGDLVLLHSSLSSLGPVDGGANSVIDAFIGVLGDEGTLVVPTFGDLGVIPQTLKQRPDAIASVHPKASVAAVGRHAAELCARHWEPDLAHGPDTPYGRLADRGGYVCLLGVDQDRSTILHAAEELLRLPYLERTDEETFGTPAGQVTRSWPFFPGPHRDFIGLDRLLRERGGMTVGRIGSAVVRLMQAQAVIDVCLEQGRTDPAFALCDNPNCTDCVAQRAALRRARLRQEPFVLAASAQLAGRYVPEMIGNCRAAGIEAVELDCIEGRPIDALGAADIDRALAELGTGGLHAIGLRARSAGARTADLVEVAAGRGVGRVTVPFGPDGAANLRRAAECGVTLCFANTCECAALVRQLLEELAAGGLAPRLCFGAAAFTRGGEKPFRHSLRQKLRRYLDALELEDCLYDGTWQPLGQGNAELRELLSILRCASFRGPVLLGANCRFSGTLRQTADRFVALLDSI